MVKKNEMGDSNVGKVRVVGRLVKKIEMGDPQAGLRMKKVETGGLKVGDLVKKIQMNEPKVGKVWRSATVGREEYLKLEQDAMLAEAGEEDDFIYIIGKV